MMKWGLVAAAALLLLWPSPSIAQSSSQSGQTSQSGAPNPGAKRPHKPSAKPNKPTTGRPAVKPHRPPPHGKPPSAVKPGHRPPQMVRPLPPRPREFYHRGRWFGRIHGPAYSYPHGWRYRRWAIGVRLPPLLFAPAYYYVGWGALGLEAPLPGYMLVRFGPDLLLVNLHTGEVEDVVYGVFF